MGHLRKGVLFAKRGRSSRLNKGIIPLKVGNLAHSRLQFFTRQLLGRHPCRVLKPGVHPHTMGPCLKGLNAPLEKSGDELHPGQFLVGCAAKGRNSRQELVSLCFFIGSQLMFPGPPGFHSSLEREIGYLRVVTHREIKPSSPPLLDRLAQLEVILSDIVASLDTEAPCC